MELELAEWGSGEAPPPPGGFIRKHWRGDYSLVRSFWVNALLLQAGHTAFWGVVIYLLQDVPAHWIARLVLLLGATSLALTVWSEKGIWSSAAREIREGASTFWPRAAQGSVLLVILGNLGSLAPGIPAAKSIVQVALEEEPWPPAIVSLSIDRRAVLVRGALHHRVSDEVERLLEANPSVRFLSLDSGGGWIREGSRLAELVRRYELTTHSRQQCASACTLPFLAGASRVLERGAKIGFHSSSSFLGPADGGNRILRSAYLAAGMSRNFVEEMLSVPAEVMRYPEHARLLEQGVITDVYDSRPFDPARLWRESREAFGQGLALYVSPFEPLARYHPEIFASLADEGWEMLEQEHMLSEIIEWLQGKAFEAVDEVLPLAPDETLSDFHRRVRGWIATLRSRDPGDPACDDFLYRGYRAAPKILVSLAFIEDNRPLIYEVFLLARESNRQLVRDSTLEAAFAPVLDQLSLRQRRYLFAEDDERMEPAEGSCTVLLTYLDALSQLPESKRRIVLRSVYDLHD